MAETPNSNVCTITVNGVEVSARPGQMLIEVTDAVGAYVPRFCYHQKLTVAANCRMCLVEIESAPKPMPACATPVTPGMKVQTKSAKAIGAQRATMEFLLINHPLDCPICDQGGECELQDLAMGYGRDLSRFTERKRVVKDKDIGPLVSTDMTRCIHCTRCVRFTQEISGFQELGTIGRGDRVEISPYLERSINHELSGNIIDLCPVGALNSKPYRFSARAWELVAQPALSPHDCVGSNLSVHLMGGRVKRVVPRDNESVNETWLSDRDRFGYEGLYSPDRLEAPMLRDEAGWRAVSWDEALDAVASGLKAAGSQTCALVSPGATVEEGYLLHRLLGGLGSSHIDHRLRRRDFRAEALEPATPGIGMSLADLEGIGNLLVIGSNLRKEVPLLAHRVRKAALRGAGVSFIDIAKFPYLFPVRDQLAVTAGQLVSELGRVVIAAGGKADLAGAGGAALEPGDSHRRIAAGLRDSGRNLILLGPIAARHARYAELQVLAAELARVTGASLGFVTEGPNSAGLSLAGALPNRGPGGVPGAQRGSSAGMNAAEIGRAPRAAVLVLGVEPESDCADGAAVVHALQESAFAVALTPYFTDAMRGWANVALPIAAFAENEGTFVNVEGRWQSFCAVARPQGEARPAWKVLRVLGNRLGVSGFEFESADAVCRELREKVAAAGTPVPAQVQITGAAGAPTPETELDIPMYSVDSLVRRAQSLQLTADALAARPALKRSA
jgi:NADH-quinone oxidoreductase subunit G